MQVTLTLPDELARQLLTQADPNRFAREAIQSALQECTRQEKVVDKPLSKWAALAQRIRENPINLGEYREVARQHGKEFREGVIFDDDCV